MKKFQCRSHVACTSCSLAFHLTAALCAFREKFAKFLILFSRRLLQPVAIPFQKQDVQAAANGSQKGPNGDETA